MNAKNDTGTPSPAPPTGWPRGNGALVLVADDEPNIRDMVRRILEAQGYRTIMARDGLEACHRFTASAGEIKMAVLDTMMPEMTGVETAKAIRRLVPGLPILLMSGSRGNSPLPESATALFLRKPFGKPGLLTAVAALLDGTVGGHRGPSTAP